MNTSNIAILTINYKTADLLIELIKTVQVERDVLPNLQHIVVDNDSNDSSIEKLTLYKHENKLDWLHIVDAKINGGYAFGNNIAIKKAQQIFERVDFYWFLNPDTKLKANAGLNLINYINTFNVHSVGSCLEDEDGTPQVSSFNFPSVISELSSGMKVGLLDKVLKAKLVTREISILPEKCDWLAGASMMVTNHFIEKVGFMDEEYFLYYEELDYCLKAQRLGLNCYYVPSSRVYHAVGASTGISDHRKKAPRRPQYWFDSRRRFFLKNYGALTLVLSELAFIIGYSSWILRKGVFDKDALINQAPHFLKDFIKNSFLFKGIKL